MSQAVLENSPTTSTHDRSLVVVGAFLLVSLGIHVGGFWALGEGDSRSRPVPKRPVEMVMVEVQKPPPPPPEAPKPEEPPKPPPPKPRVVKPPPVKVAEAPKPLPPPPVDAPPPPNETPPPSAKPAPLVVGLSMSSTTSAGGFAAPVGNTLYGRTGPTAKAPQEVKAYSAPKYAPIYQVDSEPTVASEVKIPYPEEARRAGVEGTVTLSITIDHEGKVVAVKILKGPGYGLNEAARDAIRRFRFKPAIKGGEPVSTEMKYSYTFLLD
ncbi:MULTISPECIES: energy transducer TonB [Myxococcus]|uniref:Energy transducer TonB n=1 Tax=Myxococcus xanthus TaxID=34 RepID=A0AAE6KQJ1_MYXXA|nr:MULTISPECIES: energy transducer TonB [Myxococcus]QDE66263.1 energy transducer TonB [Myxococcus xanthus]QDE73536.1 energy transducer TonB [Myxococcus xanthus]QDE80811.1 energy transducer TonB [Myxococcus xanthus]QDE95130.1 energy transducer TonB [Myxococcus xanthus]WAM27341.1 TonB family protein [Myxococcus sp. NMCA1]